jgi:hypothetical protein
LLICQFLQLGNEALATSMKTSPSDEFNMTWAPFASLQSGLEELASLYEPWHWLGVQNVPDKWFGSNMWWQSFFIHYQSLIKHFRCLFGDAASRCWFTCGIKQLVIHYQSLIKYFRCLFGDAASRCWFTWGINLSSWWWCGHSPWVMWFTWTH